MEKIVKDSFCVIGKVGSTNDGPDFVKKLWEDANAHFDEIKGLAKYNENGQLEGLWGAMTNFSFEFLPWEDNYTKGLYLAGVEARVDTVAPKGWKKWIIPGFEYINVEVDGEDTFAKTLAHMEKENIPLVGAVQDYSDPETGKNYMRFPIAWNDSKLQLISEVKKTVKQIAPCGLHCDFCFMTKWCGGCRSACNMCSYAIMSDDNTCENVICSEKKGYDGCYECPKLRDCKIGFYSTQDGKVAKEGALYIAQYGEDAYSESLIKKNSNI